MWQFTAHCKPAGHTRLHNNPSAINDILQMEKLRHRVHMTCSRPLTQEMASRDWNSALPTAKLTLLLLAPLDPLPPEYPVPMWVSPITLLGCPLCTQP